VKFANHSGFVQRADHVAVLGRNAHGFGWQGSEPASEIKLFRRELFHVPAHNGKLAAGEVGEEPAHIQRPRALRSPHPKLGTFFINHAPFGVVLCRGRINELPHFHEESLRPRGSFPEYS
jgi:hypothetical protein